jgi:hypothetical protein
MIERRMKCGIQITPLRPTGRATIDGGIPFPCSGACVEAVDSGPSIAAEKKSFSDFIFSRVITEGQCQPTTDASTASPRLGWHSK